MRSSSGSGPGGSRFRSRRAASKCTASTRRRRWSSRCAPSRAATRSRVTIGDMADVPVDGDVRARLRRVQHVLPAVLAGSAGALLRQRRRASARPADASSIHAFVPDTSRVEAGQDVSVTEASLDRVRLDATRVRRRGRNASTPRRCASPKAGSGSSTPSCGSRCRPSSISWRGSRASPSKHRWASFDKQPFTGESGFQVSVYRA